MNHIWRKNEKKLTAAILFAVCAVQLAVLIYFGGQKTFLMCDEMFTYTSSNNAEVHIWDMPLNEWKDGDWYLAQTSAQEGHTFDYAIPYRNQKVDVHPPLYYMLIHTLSSFVPGEVSMWAGVGLNIFFMLGCTILLYFISGEIFKSRGTALATAALFGVTYGAVNMVLFVRMYTMMTFLILAHVYIYLRLLEEKELNLKACLLYGGTLVLGVLTHYYFILLAFFMAVWYFVRYWIRKQYKNACFLHVTAELCAVICLAAFPAMWAHIFNDYRGKGARENLVQLGGFGGNLKTMVEFLNDQLFSGALWVLIAGGVLLLIIYLVKYKNFPWKEFRKLYPVIFMTIAYFVLVTKIAPFITDRYLMPIYPFLYLIAVGMLCWLLGKLIKPGRAVLLCSAVFLALSVGKLNKGAPGYAGVDFAAHLEVAQEHADTYAVCIDRQYDWWDYYHLVQLLKEHKGFFSISYAAITDDIEVGLEALEGENEVIVYVGDSELNEEITAYIQETVGAYEMELLDTYSRWKIYLARRN